MANIKRPTTKTSNYQENNEKRRKVCVQLFRWEKIKICKTKREKCKCLFLNHPAPHRPVATVFKFSEENESVAKGNRLLECNRKGKSRVLDGRKLKEFKSEARSSK